MKKPEDAQSGVHAGQVSPESLLHIQVSIPEYKYRRQVAKSTKYGHQGYQATLHQGGQLQAAAGERAGVGHSITLYIAF